MRFSLYKLYLVIRTPKLPIYLRVSMRKTAGEVSSGFNKMERAKRLELSTSTLARWCSTN